MRNVRTSFFILFFVGLLSSCLSTDLTSFVSSFGNVTSQEAFTNSEAIEAMKDALVEGITVSASELSTTDGYFGDSALKIFLPEEARVMVDNIGKIPGGQRLVDDVVLRLNRSAEEAAKDVVPIFTDVIKEMTVADGISIVCGGDNAATEYLREKTYDKLYNLYRPKMAGVLEKPLVAGISADKAWTTLSDKYNEIGEPVNFAAEVLGKEAPMPPVEVDLAGYATKKALDGLFVKIAEEEAVIRENPLNYASDMIQKVFGAVKAGLVN